MSFTIGKYGLDTLASLGKLMACFLCNMPVVYFLVLGSILRIYGYSILKMLKYIGEELWIVLGILIESACLRSCKIKRLGCSDSVVGLVVPTGYSFNLTVPAFTLQWLLCLSPRL